MNCEKCGADIGEDVETCPNCGAPISANKKSSKKTIILIVALIFIILCCSFLFLQQATQESEIDSVFGGQIIGNEGTNFTINANVTHKNMFGAIVLNEEELNVTVKDDAGNVVNKMTVKECEWHSLGNLPQGHYTVELSYAGNFPPANSTKDFTVTSA